MTDRTTLRRAAEANDPDVQKLLVSFEAHRLRIAEGSGRLAVGVGATSDEDAMDAAERRLRELGYTASHPLPEDDPAA